MDCPDCGGPMWDNRQNKRNPKQPDYKCKNKEGCGKGVWTTPKGSMAPAAHQPNGNGDKVTWKELGDTYQRCAKLAAWAWAPIKLSDEALVAAAATVFIQASKSDLVMREAKAAPPPPPPPPVQEPPDDDDLPF